MKNFLFFSFFPLLVLASDTKEFTVDEEIKSLRNELVLLQNYQNDTRMEMWWMQASLDDLRAALNMPAYSWDNFILDCKKHGIDVEGKEKARHGIK